MDAIQLRIALPDELLVKVLREVNRYTRSQAALVSKHFHAVATSVLYSSPSLNNATIWPFKRAIDSDPTRISAVRCICIDLSSTSDTEGNQHHDPLTIAVLLYILRLLSSLRTAEIILPGSAAPDLHGWISDRKSTANGLYALNISYTDFDYHPDSEQVSDDEDYLRRLPWLSHITEPLLLPNLQELKLFSECYVDESVPSHRVPVQYFRNGNAKKLTLHVDNMDPHHIADLMLVPRALSEFRYILDCENVFDGLKLRAGLDAHCSTLTALEIVPLDNDAEYRQPLGTLETFTSLTHLSLHWYCLFRAGLHDADAPQFAEVLPKSVQRLGLWMSVADPELRLSLEFCVNAIINSLPQLPSLRALYLEPFNNARLDIAGMLESYRFNDKPLASRLLRSCHERGIALGRLQAGNPSSFCSSEGSDTDEGDL